jgi:hypothetical protein
LAFAPFTKIPAQVRMNVKRRAIRQALEEVSRTALRCPSEAHVYQIKAVTTHAENRPTDMEKLSCFQYVALS